MYCFATIFLSSYLFFIFFRHPQMVCVFSFFFFTELLPSSSPHRNSSVNMYCMNSDRVVVGNIFAIFGNITFSFLLAIWALCMMYILAFCVLCLFLAPMRSRTRKSSLCSSSTGSKVTRLDLTLLHRIWTCDRVEHCREVFITIQQATSTGWISLQSFPHYFFSRIIFTCLLLPVIPNRSHSFMFFIVIVRFQSHMRERDSLYVCVWCVLQNEKLEIFFYYYYIWFSLNFNIHFFLFFFFFSYQMVSAHDLIHVCGTVEQTHIFIGTRAHR